MEIDKNKVGHKYTEDYKQVVRSFHHNSGSDLTLTLNWIRRTYPEFKRNILRTWVDKDYNYHLNNIRYRNNQNWIFNHPEKYEKIKEQNQKDQLERYGVKRREKTKQWRDQNKSHLTEYHKQRWINNKDEILAKKRQRKKEDPVYKILENTRTYIWQQLQRAFSSTGKEFNKDQTTCELIGCTPDEYLHHLRSQYQPGMTDENYGEWHVDHIIPCSSFDLTNDEEKKKCFNFKNVQPLWKIDNLSKGNKIR